MQRTFSPLDLMDENEIITVYHDPSDSLGERCYVDHPEYGQVEISRDIRDLFEKLGHKISDGYLDIESHHWPGQSYEGHSSDSSITSNLTDSLERNGKHSFLVLDDQASVCKLVSKVLKKTHPDYTVISAENLAEGKTILESGQDEIVGAYLDNTLPDGTGPEFRQYMQQIGMGAIPVYMITGTHGLENSLNLPELGIEAIITKPFTDVGKLSSAADHMIELYAKHK